MEEVGKRAKARREEIEKTVSDVQGRVLLTPVAIAAGRRLSNRLFGPPKFKNDKLSYEDIPTVVFS